MQVATAKRYERIKRTPRAWQWNDSLESMPRDKMTRSQLIQLSGMRLARVRMSNEWSQEDVVTRLRGVWPSTHFVSRLSAYENGTRSMSIQVARQLGAVLDVPAAYLLCVEDTVGSVTEREVAKLYAKYREATPETRRIVNSALGIKPKGKK